MIKENFKMLSAFRIIISVILFSIVFASCKTDEDEKRTFVISYVSRIADSPEPLFVEEGTVLSTKQLPDLSYENYIFAGWYLDGKRILPGEYTITENIVLYALWDGNDCAVTFTHSDNVPGQTYTRIYDMGTEITLPETPYGEIDGLEFKGWLSGNVFYGENAGFSVTGDTVFTAYYAEQGTHTISYYHIQDGTLLSDNDKFEDATPLTGKDNPLTFTESEIVFISDLQKTGYTFEGFYTTRNCNEGEEATTFWQASTVKTDVVLFAKWKTDTYTIVFDGNAGTLIDGKTQDSLSNISYEDEITLPECNYELPGYDFLAWSVNREEYNTEFESMETIEVKEIYTSGTKNTITLYAHWHDNVNPASPANFEVIGIDSNEIELSWTASNNSDLAFTRLSYHKKGEPSTFIDFPAEEYLPGEKASQCVGELERGETYYFTVTSYDVAGNSNDYAESCTLIAIPRPKAYSPSLTFSQTSPTELKVSWDAPSSDDYPYIEKITLLVDDTEIESLTAKDGEGDCYDKNYFYYTIEPLSFYKIQLALTETTDESGKNNASKTKVYTYLSEPDFNASLSRDDNGSPIFYRYSNSLGFDLTLPVSSSDYTIIVETTQLDKDGNKIERTKAQKELTPETDKNSYGVYICNGLDSATNYFVRVYVKVVKYDNDTGTEYTAFAYALSETQKIEKATTASAGKAGIGYICYSASDFFYDKQPLGTPLGIVTQINEFNEATTVVRLNDLSLMYQNLSSAESAVSSLTDGKLIWSVPEADDILSVFDESNVETIYEAIIKAGGTWFTEATSTSDGYFKGRYLSSSRPESGYVYAFEISDLACSGAIGVSEADTSSTYSIRPFVIFKN